MWLVGGKSRGHYRFLHLMQISKMNYCERLHGISEAVRESRHLRLSSNYRTRICRIYPGIRFRLRGDPHSVSTVITWKSSTAFPGLPLSGFVRTLLDSRSPMYGSNVKTDRKFTCHPFECRGAKCISRIEIRTVWFGRERQLRRIQPKYLNHLFPRWRKIFFPSEKVNKVKDVAVLPRWFLLKNAKNGALIL